MSHHFLAEAQALNLFWLEIMKEHAIFIYAGLPHERGDLLEQAIRFEIEYRNERDEWKNNYNPTMESVSIAFSNAISLTEEFLHFKLELLQLQKTCQLGGSLFPLQLDHIAREAREYLTLLNVLSQMLAASGMEGLLHKELFWLRIMGEHASFIAHLLDPSEHMMIQTAQTFACDYDNLLAAASSLSGADPAGASAFTAQIVAETTNLRDWKAQTAALRKECKLMAIVPALFFEHVKKEANYFLSILS